MTDYGVGDVVKLKATYCNVRLEKLPDYVDRGPWIANLEVLHPISCYVSPEDIWPRHYFDLDRAKGEILDWLKIHDQVVAQDWTDELTDEEEW